MDSPPKISTINLEDTFIKLLSTISPGDEFEIGFKQSEYKITMERYIILLKYFAMMSHEHKYKIEQTDTLNVSYNYDYQDFNNYRVTIHGLDNINKKMNKISHRENHIIFSMLFTDFINQDKSENVITAINKIKEKKNMIDIEEYGIRARFASEKDINSKEHDTLLKISEKDRRHINFRYIQRVSLILEDNNDYTIRIDLSQVKSSNKINILEKNIPGIELEIDVSFKKSVTSKKVLKSIINTIETQIYSLHKVLQKSTVIVNKTLTSTIIEKLKVLIFKDKEMNIKDLPAMQTQAAEIPHIVDNIPNKYSVTDKADGERAFLFITEGIIYLISNTLEVKQLESKYFKNIDKFNDTILDGEYIFIANKQKFIFLSFDCLFLKGEDIRTETKLELRLQKLYTCTKELFNQKNFSEQYNGNFDLDIIKKFYSEKINNQMKELNKKLDDPNSGPNIIMSKNFIFPLGINPCEVFTYSSLIWDLYTKSHTLNCPYVLDGIIYTAIDQIYTKNLRETKNRMYKWKPSSKNSLDFYIEFERHRETNQILDVYDDTEANTNILNNEDITLGDDSASYRKKGVLYRILNLFVGKIDGGKEYPILFQKDKNNYICNIVIQDGEARDIENNIIQDKTVVEFTYINDPNIPAPYRWKALRTRHDKTDTVNMYKRKYGNNSEIAEKTWRSIMDGVEISDIELLAKIETYDSHNRLLKSKITSDVITLQRRDNAYYQIKTNLAKPLREFHNWIKTNMIDTYCSKKVMGSNTKLMDILDYSCGVGGDILKFYHARVNSYIGFDIDPNGIYSGSDGALSRYQDFKKKFPNFPKMTFFVADGGAQLTVDDQSRSLGSIMSEQNKKIIKEIFDIEKPKQYDIINCQFAVHYFFKTDLTLKNFMTNIKKFLSPSGFLLLTTFDSEMVNKSFDENNRITTYYTTLDGNKKIIFDIIKKYNSSDMNNTGISIDVHLPAFEEDKYQTEYLVSYDFMISTMKSYGLRLVDSDLFGNIFEKHRHFFDNAAKNEETNATKKWFMNVKEYYNHEDSMNRACFAYTKLNRYYVFQMEDTSSGKEQKYEFKTKSKK